MQNLKINSVVGQICSIITDLIVVVSSSTVVYNLFNASKNDDGVLQIEFNDVYKSLIGTNVKRYTVFVVLTVLVITKLVQIVNSVITSIEKSTK